MDKSRKLKIVYYITNKDLTFIIIFVYINQ